MADIYSRYLYVASKQFGTTVDELHNLSVRSAGGYDASNPEEYLGKAKYMQSVPANSALQQTENEMQAQYETDVDAVINNTYGKQDNLLLGVIPDVFQQLGVARLPLVIGQKHVYSISVDEATAKADGRYDPNTHYHNLGKENVKKLREALSDPITIIASETHPDTSVVAFVEIPDKTGKNIVIPVAINGFGKIGNLDIDASAITSAQERKNAVSKLITDAINVENSGKVGIFYANAQKIRSLPLSVGVQFPAHRTQSNGTLHNITDKNSPVKTLFSDATETRQFKRFFGDWQNNPDKASKVVDKDRRPLPVYHRTNEIFSIFDRGKLYSQSLWPTADWGFYFSDDNEGYGNISMPCYLNIRNPKYIEVVNMSDFDWEYKHADYEALLKGHDGAIIHSTKENKNWYVALSPNQIKSVDNLGTFNSENNNIYMQNGEDKTPKGTTEINRTTGSKLVELFAAADSSTFVHEMGHVILEDLIRYGQLESATDTARANLTTVLDFLGISDMDVSDLDHLSAEDSARLRAAHEKWAEAFGKYIADGVAPSTGMRAVFKQVRRWLIDLFTEAERSGVELSPEVRGVFDSLLATPQEMDEFYEANTTLEELLKENSAIENREEYKGIIF